jgi:hypothetical protein
VTGVQSRNSQIIALPATKLNVRTNPHTLHPAWQGLVPLGATDTDTASVNHPGAANNGGAASTESLATL